MYTIEPVLLSSVQNNPSRYNVNNDRTHGRPEDYFDFGLKTQTSAWVDQFHSNYRVINIQAYWLAKAAIPGGMAGIFPRTFSEELTEYLESMTKTFERVFDGTPYFVRSERTSLKYGVHGAGPYYDLKSIIESLITSIPDHSPLPREPGPVKLYLFPWLDINPDTEFRVFVYNGVITAISQQHLHGVNKSASDEIIPSWLDCITRAFTGTIRDMISHLDTYTYDFAILRNGEPYFIEINSFGAAYSAGSALFHWTIDREILTPERPDQQICFRYVVPTPGT